MILALVMLAGIVPQIALPAHAAEEGAGFEGKKVSILGDSISTYTGVSNNAASNSTIANNRVYHSAGTLNVYRPDTW